MWIPQVLESNLCKNRENQRHYRNANAPSWRREVARRLSGTAIDIKDFSVNCDFSKSCTNKKCIDSVTSSRFARLAREAYNFFSSDRGG
jgi:hypothetical protein